MSMLAIKGHPTRGKEVIEILEMLGGKSYTALPYQGNDIDKYYYINKVDNYINAEAVWRTLLQNRFQVFTLEKFLEKFPYKVGDRVIAYAEGCLAQFTIQAIRWNSKLNRVEYKICSSWLDTSLMQLCKEEIKEENKLFNEILDTLSSYLIDFMTPQGIDKCIKYIKDNMDEYSKEEFKEEIKIDIPKGYEFSGVDDDKQQVVFTRIQPQYPKTYKECIGQLPINWDGNVEGYKCELLANFQKLLIARDVYWKIAGEQLGLEKPWKPDFTDDNEERYGIYTTANKVIKDFCGVGDVILTFPTEEMRDAFYENFKELIEQCKELL